MPTVQYNLFQFQYGAIKGARAGFLSPSQTSFNSSMVRLKAVQPALNDRL